MRINEANLNEKKRNRNTAILLWIFFLSIETVDTGNYIQHDKLKVHEIFLKIDTNGDGKLLKEEFITVCLQGDYLLRLFAPGASWIYLNFHSTY